MPVVYRPHLEQLWHRCQAFWNKDRNQTLKIALHSSACAGTAKCPLLLVTGPDVGQFSVQGK